jgi:hypothetical protein
MGGVLDAFQAFFALMLRTLHWRHLVEEDRGSPA